MPALTLEHKRFAVDLKASPTEEGVFEGYASIFGNIDSYGDVMVKGAFADSLARRLPMLSWEHEWQMGPVGEVLEAREDDRGLYVKAQLYIEDPPVRRIYRSLKAGQIKEMSFAFQIVEAENGEQDGKSVRFVKAVDAPEVALVVVGANRETEVMNVRSIDASLIDAALKEAEKTHPEPTPEELAERAERAKRISEWFWPTTKAAMAMPMNASAMRQHLEGAHEMSGVGDASMAQMRQMHDAAHSGGGSDHTHEED